MYGTLHTPDVIMTIMFRIKDTKTSKTIRAPKATHFEETMIQQLAHPQDTSVHPVLFTPVRKGQGLQQQQCKTSLATYARPNILCKKLKQKEA